jgi:hypothetical protein
MLNRGPAQAAVRSGCGRVALSNLKNNKTIVNSREKVRISQANRKEGRQMNGKAVSWGLWKRVVI